MTRRTLMRTIAAGSLVVAAVATPTAVNALSGSKSAAAPMTNTTPPPPLDKKCQYPPKRAPLVTLNASPNSIKPNSQVNLNGKVTLNKCKVAGRTVYLFASTTSATGPWTIIAETKTNPGGEFHFKVKIGTKTTWYKALSEGDSSLDSAHSNIEKVTVR